MIITRLQASNFLSFDTFDLQLGSGVNVVVGPNGAGKSNVLRIASTMFGFLSEVAARERLPQRLALSAEWVWDRLVPRVDSGRPDGWLAVTVRLDDDELEGLGRFVRAVAETKTLEGIRQRHQGALRPPADLNDLLNSRLDLDALEALRTGRLVLSFSRRAAREYKLAYEFQADVEGSPTLFHVVIAGSTPASTVHRGSALASYEDTPANRDAPISLLPLETAEGQSALRFSSLLPDETATFWALFQSNIGPHPLRDACLESLRPDLLSAGYAWELPFGSALCGALLPRITSAEGIRGVPQFDYTPWPGFDHDGSTGAPTVPLRLYRLLVGSAAQRREYDRIAKTFKRLTGLTLAVQASETAYNEHGREELSVVDDADSRSRLAWVRVPGATVGTLRCEPRVLLGNSDIRVDLAGAGVWEALVNTTIATPSPGGVALLDEPATNMFPQLQRDFLAHLDSIDKAQIVMVTHSPYLVPVRTNEDIARITRVDGGHGEPTVPHRFAPSEPPAPAPRRGRPKPSAVASRLAARDEVRSALFARGVIAAEGESERVLLSHVLNDPTVTGDGRTLESRGYQVIDVEGEARFGAYLEVLIGFQVPFVVLIDGPGLRHDSHLARFLTQRGVALAAARSNESFRSRRQRSASHGIFTLAESFGGRSAKAPTCTTCRRLNAHPQPGEIEWWLHRRFRGAFHQASATRTSSGRPKPLVIRDILDRIDFRRSSRGSGELVTLYEAIDRSLTQGGVQSRRPTTP